MIQLSPLRLSQTPPIHPSVLRFLVSLFDVPPALWHVSASATARRIASKSERFTRSRRGFLCHRYQLRSCGHDKLRVDEKCVRERVQVRCSDFAPTNCCICQSSGTPSRQVAQKESVTCTTPKHLTPQHPLLELQRAEQRVNTIPPDTEIHEQMTMTNGYDKECVQRQAHFQHR